MRAVGYQRSLPADHPEALVDIELPVPEPAGRDLLVEVRAVSVNPIDTKVRRRAAPEPGGWKVLGFDAAGVVASAGQQASLFRPGDAVYYAGSIARQGTNAEFHLVDERIVGRKPRSLDWAGSAALPLTAITAWEMLFDRLEIRRPVAGAAPVLLVIGGAGGVGSMAVQLARRLTDLTVVATASRPESRAWAGALGAHHVIDHSQPLQPQLAALGLGAPGLVFSTTHTEQHIAAVVGLIAPQGRFGYIDDLQSIDPAPFKAKSVSIRFESMFTRPVFGTADLGAQHELLDEVSRLVDLGQVRTTLAERMAPISAENLRRAHEMIERGWSHGKLVLEGFGDGQAASAGAGGGKLT
jgi:zinc-binding alcohol dehydrogenase family protein